MTATYPPRLAARASNTTTRTLRRWLDNNVVALRGSDRKSSGSGHQVGLSRARILQTAITQHLLAVGVSLSTAATAALVFSDAGQTARPAGELFRTGKTLLILGANGPTVISADFDASLADLSARGVSLTVVDLNKIVDQVDATLNKEDT